MTLANDLDRIIEVQGQDEVLAYSEKRFFEEAKYGKKSEKFLTNPGSCLHELREAFEQRHLVSYGLQASDWKLSYVSEYQPEVGTAKNYSLLRCSIEGSWSGSWFKFQWLLKPILLQGHDLYDFEYTKGRKSLVYTGPVNGIRTKIVLRFPEPIDHCHYHVWYQE